MAPSSFGLEHWKLLVINNKDIKEKLKAVSWNQPQITTSSKLVVILAKMKDLHPESEYVINSFKRKTGKSKEQFEKYLQVYSGHYKITISNNPDKLFGWSKAQCFFAACNMMNMAATLGIDSCPIEGFEEDNVLKILNIDPQIYRIALILPFGYRVREQQAKVRSEIEQLVEYIN